jgi:hypothetical protein
METQLVADIHGTWVLAIPIRDAIANAERDRQGGKARDARRDGSSKTPRRVRDIEAPRAGLHGNAMSGMGM